MSGPLSRLPGPELDKPPLSNIEAQFAAAVRAHYMSTTPKARRPRGWKRAVARAARLITARCLRVSTTPALPGIYGYGVGDPVRVSCSLGGAPSRLAGVVLWGPAMLFGRVWARVSGLGMVPAGRVKRDGGVPL